ncbi:unnamed protein product [Effrenium voratum]|nr:unnamed protein product [Effrenium voratum]
MAGIAYGATATLVGHPLDTVKTFMQTEQLSGRDKASTVQTAASIARVGPVTFYRGAVPVLAGALLFRSLPFTVYSGTYSALPHSMGESDRVLLSGIAAALGRTIVESPCEALKTQKQVWDRGYLETIRAGHMWQGLAATCSRNLVLVPLFFCLSDKFNSAELIDFRQRPFLRGCCVTACCWLAAFPLDVVKSRVQAQAMESGPLPGGIGTGLRLAWHERGLYRGLAAQLLRSCLANGAAMWMYQKVQQARTF